MRLDIYLDFIWVVRIGGVVICMLVFDLLGFWVVIDDWFYVCVLGNVC